MTLIRELVDSKEGLIGILEDGEKVHLGVPKPYSCIHKVRDSDKDRWNDLKEVEERLREDEVAYWYFDRDCSRCYSYTSIKGVMNYTYTRFETEKQKAIERGQDSYPVEKVTGTNYVRIK